MGDLPSFGQTIRLALRLDGPIYVAAQSSPMGIWMALAVVILASASEALGQSMVLFINHVRPRRVALALSMSTLSRLTGYVLWSVTVWLVASFLFGATVPFVGVAAVVGLAYAPQLLAFFELTPFLGNPFGLLLSLWSMLAIIVAVQTGLGLTFWEAVVTSGIGWLLIQAWRRSIGRPVYALGSWLERRAAGSPLTLKLKDIPQLRHRSDLIENWQHWRDRLSRSRLAALAQMAARSQELAAPGREREGTRSIAGEEEGQHG